MSDGFSSVFIESLKVTTLVFVMMVIVDLASVLTRGNIAAVIRGGRWRPYVLSSLLGVIPGCLGAFTNVSLYTHGLLSFGAVTGGMIAASGDEAFVMLALFPRQDFIPELLIV